MTTGYFELYYSEWHKHFHLKYQTQGYGFDHFFENCEDAVKALKVYLEKDYNENPL